MRRSKPLDRFEAIQGILDELRSRGPDAVIVVEGDRDVSALAELDVPQPIVKLNIGESLLDLCESLARSYKTVVLMTDWDPKGRQLATRLRQLLRATGVQVDGEPRRRLSRLVKYEVQDVESLPKHVKRLRVAAGVDSRRTRRDGTFTDGPGSGAADE